MSLSSVTFWAQASVIGLSSIFLIIQIIWIIRYWLYRKSDFIAIRQYNATIFICICACSYQLWTILSIIWGIWNLFTPSHWEIILTFVLYIMILGGSAYIFMYKAWILYYNASYYEAYTDIEWKTYISIHNNESNNWYIKNKQLYGNPKYCLCFILSILCILTCFGLIPFHYESFEYKIILLISSLIPCIVTVIIANKMYCVDDIFKLKREITMYCRFGLVSIISIYILIFFKLNPLLYLLFTFIPSFALFWSVYFQTAYVIKIFKDEIFIDTNNNILHENKKIKIDQISQRKLALHIIHSHTDNKCVTHTKNDSDSPGNNIQMIQMDELSRNISNSIKIKIDRTNIHTPSSQYYPSTPVSSNIANITPYNCNNTPNTNNVIALDISGEFPDINEITIPQKHKVKVNKIKLVDIIQDAQWFGLFIRHVTKEFAFENVLYIIETVQFQQRLMKNLKHNSNNSDENIENKNDIINAGHLRTPTITDEINNIQRENNNIFKAKNIILPHTVPRSQIVFGDCKNWFRKMVSKKSIAENECKETDNNNGKNGKECECKQCVYNPYKQAILIYNKYLNTNGILSVNISHEERIKFHKLFEINHNDKDKKQKIYMLSKKRLIDIFEESQQEVWHLLGASFRRFKKTPIFAKIASER